jgi:hypothetical protein
VAYVAAAVVLGVGAAAVLRFLPACEQAVGTVRDTGKVDDLIQLYRQRTRSGDACHRTLTGRG